MPTPMSVIDQPSTRLQTSSASSRPMMTLPAACSRFHCAARRGDVTTGNIGTFAQGEGERVDEDGFAGAGLAGECAETLRKFQLQLVNNDEVADDQALQHGGDGQLRGVALQCSFSRSMAK